MLNHGTHPHGEAWLYEAAAETYLPLLDLLEEVGTLVARPALTVGLTPVLLEQLGHERFKDGFVDYLNGRRQCAVEDRREFEQGGRGELAELASGWEDWYGRRLEAFERIKRDIPGAFAAHWRAGHLQLLTGNATHAYMPLLLKDESIAAQMACGMLTSRKHFGTAPRGMWLPECAYRPTVEEWRPAVLGGENRRRVGLERFIAGAGVDHFFVDSHLIAKGQPLGVLEGGKFKEMGERSCIGIIGTDGRTFWSRWGWRAGRRRRDVLRLGGTRD